jgi:hypothetical protein
LFGALSGCKLELKKGFDRGFGCLAEIVLVVQLGEQVLIFFLKEELGLFLFFDSFFSLNEMKIFLIASLEDGVLKSN